MRARRRVVRALRRRNLVRRSRHRKDRARGLHGRGGRRRSVAFGLEYGFLPTTSFGGVNLSARTLAGDVRVFPFDAPFFLGVRAGRMHVDGSMSATVGNYGTFTGSATSDTWFLNPRIGLLRRFPFGLSVGIDVGLQVPLSSTSTVSVPNGVPVPSSVTSATSFFAHTLPTITLLQVGMSF